MQKVKVKKGHSVQNLESKQTDGQTDDGGDPRANAVGKNLINIVLTLFKHATLNFGLALGHKETYCSNWRNSASKLFERSSYVIALAIVIKT